MKTALTAGGTFAGAVIAGFALGLVLGKLTGRPLMVLAGLFAGVALGGYIACRALLEAGK